MQRQKRVDFTFTRKKATKFAKSLEKSHYLFAVLCITISSTLGPVLRIVKILVVASRVA